MTWKAVIGYEGLYAVSDTGQVKRVTPSRRNRAGFMPALCDDGKGYPVVTLFANETRKMWHVHQLVCSAFIGPRPVRYDVNHKNGITNDNRLENLEYLTHGDNVRHCVNVLSRHVGPPRGEGHHKAKLTNAQAARILALKREGYSANELAKEFNVSVWTIFKMVANLTWKNIPR